MQLFDEWAASYARGEQPDPLEYLERAGPGRDELAALMDGFLRAVPRGEPSEETIALTRAWAANESPLGALRSNQGITRDDVVDAVMTEFALDPGRRAKVMRYYHELESGLLDATHLDRRLADLIARTLNATREAILTWRPLQLQGVYLRATEPVEDFALADSTFQQDDEVDHLFLSGR